MIDKEKVIKGLKCCFETATCDGCPYEVERRKIPLKTPENHCPILDDVLALLDEQSNLIGTRVTADGITFISTGTAQDGEARGLLLGKMAMHEWLKKKLFYRGLLTDEIRAVFDEAKRR